MQNPDSLLCKFFGFHLIAPRDNKEMYFTVMENTFLPQFTIHERYDLKVIPIWNNEYDSNEGPIICIYLLSLFPSLPATSFHRDQLKVVQQLNLKRNC